MKCVEIEKLLDQFVAGELDSATRRKIDSHLHECAGCFSEAENLETAARLLKNIPLIAPSKQLDARIMQAFRQHQETQNQPSFWTAFFNRFSISKPALACATLILIAFTALAFQLGRISAPTNEIAGNRNVESAAPVVQIVEKRVEIPVIKTVEVPIYRDRIVSRIIYKNRGTIRPIKISEGEKTDLRENHFDLQNTAVNFVQNGSEIFTPIDLKSFHPVPEIKLNVIRTGRNDEK